MNTSITNLRPVQTRVTAHRQLEGGGFPVRRPLPTQGLELVDPFLLVDEMGPTHFGPGEAVGAPDHPHRGFETVTYLLEGAVEHRDSAGHGGRLGPGDVQWMTAGAGVVHREMPPADILESGGPAHGFQIWVNLPAKDKMSRPRYQEVARAEIPVAESADGKARAVVIAGEALGVSARIDTRTPIVFQHWTLAPGARVDVPVPADHNLMAYVFRGSARLGPKAMSVSDGQLAVFGAGDAARLAALDDGPGAELLLLGGVPIDEPVARYGPFVMNTREELVQAFRDFHAGRMGHIPAEISASR